MNKLYGDIVIVTGASSGLGKATAETLTGMGYKVYGTSRSAQAGKFTEVIPASSNNPGFLRMIQLDVCSEESAANAINIVLKEEGKVNILINNAGYGIAGSVEDTSIDEAYSQFNTNFFGMLRMSRAVLPTMRKQNKGLIINLSSVAGVISIPYQSMYSASKYAIEAVTEAMRMELKPFNIKVSMVEPGDTKTGFTDKRKYVEASNKGSVYYDSFIKSITSMEKSEQNGPGPHLVVKEILRIMNRKNPPVRATAGFSYKAIVFLKRLVPAKLIEFAVTKLY